MRATLLKELRAELAARRNTRDAAVSIGAGRRRGMQPAALFIAAPVTAAAVFVMLWFQVMT